MRRSTSAFTLTVVLTVTCCLSPVAHAEDCHYDPGEGVIVCSPSGPGTPGNPPPSDRPPIRYVYASTDPVIGDCHYWSRTPGGLDAWNPANDPAVIRLTTSTPVCPVVTSDPPATVAWRIFRSFPLALPAPAFEPSESGITGLPTYLSTPDPTDITHTELLPDGRTLEVRASVAALVVDWGDGAKASFDSSEARSYPAGSVTHTYTTKTCDAAYREEHPSGGNCDPNLEAYPITATFTWAGRYRVGASWIDLGTLNRTITVAYDVDEVQGVLEP